MLRRSRAIVLAYSRCECARTVTKKPDKNGEDAEIANETGVLLVSGDFGPRLFRTGDFGR